MEIFKNLGITNPKEFLKEIYSKDEVNSFVFLPNVIFNKNLWDDIQNLSNGKCKSSVKGIFYRNYESYISNLIALLILKNIHKFKTFRGYGKKSILRKGLTFTPGIL